MSCSTTGTKSDGEAVSQPTLTQEDVKEAYAEALAAQIAGLEATRPLGSAEAGEEAMAVPLHMGVAFRPSAIGELMKREVGRQVLGALPIEDGVLSVAGKEIPVRLEHEFLELELRPDQACEHCLRIGGKIAGRFDVDLPLLGEREDEPYAGEFSVVAPLEFVRVGESQLAIRLDTNQIPRLGGLWVDLKLESLPERVQKPVREQLNALFTERLSGSLEPLTLVTFRGYDLGLDNVALMPAGLSYDVGTSTYFAGVGTNLADIEGEVAPLHALGRDAVLGVTTHLHILTHRTRLKMHQGELAMRYGLGGEADEAGPVRVLLRGIRGVDAPQGAEQPGHLEVELEVFVFGEGEGAVPAERNLLVASLALPSREHAAHVIELRSASATALDLEAWRESAVVGEFVTLLDTMTTPRQVSANAIGASYGLHQVMVRAPGLSATMGRVEDE
ncbi:hypothetical protein FRC98_15705 [Lujinxingia vulgaris]|uniref:DUF4403 family protein n=1 Tax=Lujinxingia vulgaris TaxID=2600176 RepID=A0A5C6X1Q8_9DELT|nr:hypothetical protein [Lujinxingia vulgaris]TXD35650.1 hypothetical protein FRC98_15705 [Lujinxingia vulgaris]